MIRQCCVYVARNITRSVCESWTSCWLCKPPKA